MAAGVDAQTGRPISGDARIVQSIRRLVVTAHDLVMRRHLACRLPDQIGTPSNPVEKLAYASAVAQAILNGEPRCDLQEVRFLDVDELPGLSAERAADGAAWLNIVANSRETGAALRLTELVT